MITNISPGFVELPAAPALPALDNSETQPLFGDDAFTLVMPLDNAGDATETPPENSAIAAGKVGRVISLSGST